MNRHLVMSAMVLSASLFGAQALHAYRHVNAPVRAAFIMEGKMVKLSIHNDTKTPIRLKTGDAEVSIEPGKTIDVKLRAGTEITVLEAANREPGSAVATVSEALSGGTITLH